MGKESNILNCFINHEVVISLLIEPHKIVQPYHIAIMYII